MKRCVSPKAMRPSTSWAAAPPRRAHRHIARASAADGRARRPRWREDAGRTGPARGAAAPHRVYPDDMALLAGPIAGLVDRDIGDAPTVGVDAAGDDALGALFGRRRVRGLAIERSSDFGGIDLGDGH